MHMYMQVHIRLIAHFPHLFHVFKTALGLDSVLKGKYMCIKLHGNSSTLYLQTRADGSIKNYNRVLTN